MLNLIQADLYKLYKSMAIKILFGITTVSALLMTMIAYQVAQGNMDKNMTGIGFMLSDVNMMSILGAVVAGILICGDFDSKGIQDAISSGSSRASIIVSKTIVFSISILFILLPYIIATIVALCTGSKFSMGSNGVGLLNLMTSGSSVSNAGKLIVVVLALAIVYGAQLSICVPLAFTLKKPVFVVAIFYGITILCAQLIGLKGSSKVFDNIFACTPYGGKYSFITLSTDSGDIIKAITVSLIFTILMAVITYCAFRRTEIK
jgi:ABC-2 type transport system permease protein